MEVRQHLRDALSPQCDVQVACDKLNGKDVVDTVIKRATVFGESAFREDTARHTITVHTHLELALQCACRCDNRAAENAVDGNGNRKRGRRSGRKHTGAVHDEIHYIKMWRLYESDGRYFCSLGSTLPLLLLLACL